MPLLTVDFTRPLDTKQRASFQHRGALLETGKPFARSVEAATTNLRDMTSGRDLLLRHDYVYLREPIAAEAVSDRRAPRREVRPSATRISSSQGAALRFHLSVLAVAQATTKRGKRARLPDLPITAFNGSRGWTDILASAATPSGKGEHYSSVRDKKVRSVHAALDTLEDSGLVALPGAAGARGRYDGFVLLHEVGRKSVGDPIPYLVPAESEVPVFSLPAGFVTNGWLHVLSDSEINLLLMVASGRSRLFPWGDTADLLLGEVAVPGDIRLRHYGIHRDPYSTARKTLEWFGLLRVREVERHEDGRGEDGAQKLHRLSLNQSGLDANALDVVRAVIGEQLARA